MMPARRAARTTGWLRAVVATAVVATGVALAGVPTASARADDGTTPVMVILDASGSMTTADAPGPRIDAAKQAVDNLIDALPASAQVGLEVYGTHTGSSDAEKAAGCKDISVLAPVRTIDPSALKAQVAGITARGYTPIGNALETAAAQLPKEGPRSIVLVSDGEDTCAPPDPCTVAQQLKAQGIDLTIDTIGFRVDNDARNQLSCIAAATGGSYYDANDASSLSTQLGRGVTRAMKPYDVVGQPIDGTATIKGAPKMTPGQYVDAIPSPATSSATDASAPKYYRIAVKKGWTPYVSVTLIPSVSLGAEGGVLSTRVVVSGPTGDTSACQYQDDESEIVARKAFSPLTAVATSGAVGGSTWPSGCPTDGTMLVAVTRTGAVGLGSPMRAELSYRLEPPADTTGQPPAATVQPDVALTPGTTATPITSGTSYNDAPVLTSGTYSDSIVSGESRFVAVKLDWGQRLAFRFDAEPIPGLGPLDATMADAQLSSPLRQNLTLSAGFDPTIAFLGSSGSPQTLGGTTAAPVRYLNRTSGDSAVAPYSVAGTYYVWITAGLPTDGDPSYEAKYTLTLKVIGAAEPGPKYLGAETPTATPPAHAASKPASRAQDAGPVVAIAVGAGVVVLVLVGLGIVLLRRRHRPTDTAV